MDGEAKPQTRVFISYSRKDTAFVDRLSGSLQARGFDVLLDREDISGGEAWRERLDALILRADAVIFVISPDSISSSVCAWETERTVELGKRLVPLCWRRIDDSSAPAQLARLNYIFVEAEDQYEDGVARAAAACDVDISWVREHTRLVDLATRWDADGRNDAALLRGEVLADAEGWLSRRSPLGPSVPETLNAFLQAGRAVEAAALERDRRTLKRTRGLQLGVSVLVGVAAVVVLIAGVSAATLIRNLSAQRSASLSELARAAADEQMYDRAARYALAGLAGADWPLIGYDGAAAEAQLRRAVAASRAIAVLQDHGRNSALSAVAISRDGARIVTGSATGVATVWDRATGGRLFSAQLPGQIYSLSFSPDGRLILAKGGADVWLLEPDADAVRFSLASASSAVFSPGGDSILVAQGGSARILSVADGGELAQFRGQEHSIHEVAFSADGRRMATTSDQVVNVWEVDSGRQLATIPTSEEYLARVFLSHDGVYIGVEFSDGLGFACYDATTGRLIAEHGDALQLGFSADGRHVAFVLRTGFGQVYETSTGRRAPGGSWRSMGAPNLQGMLLAIPWTDGSVWVWGGRRYAIGVRGHEDFVRGAALSSNGEMLVTGSEDGNARVWDVSARRPALTRLENLSGLTAFSSDGRRLAAIGVDGILHVWDITSGREIQTIASVDPIDGRTRAIALNADGKLVAMAAGNDTVRIWNVETGAMAWTARACGEVRTLVFSPDGQRLLGGCAAEPHIWDTASGREVLILNGGGAVFSAAFSPDGTQIVTGGADADATVWEVATGRPSDWLMDVGETTSVGFSPDGSMILTGSRDGALRLWERSGFPIGTLSSDGSAIMSAQFSADGRRILSVSDRSVRLWDVESLAQIDALYQLDGDLNAVWNPDGTGARISAGPNLVDWRFASAATMNRSELIELACETTLAGELARFTTREQRQAPVLDTRHDADACHAPTIWTRLTSYFITQ